MPRPVVVGGRKGFCSRAIPGPGPSQNPALCGSPPAKCNSASASYRCESGTPLGAFVLVRANLPPPALPLWTKKLSTSAALPWATSLSSLPCWVVPPSKASSPAGRASSLLLSPLQGTASPCYTWPLFLHTSAGVNPARSVPGVQDAAVRVAAGCWRSVCPLRYAPGHTLRRWESAQTLRRRASIRGAVLVRGEGCAPLGRWCALTLLGRSGPGPGGRLPSHNVGLFRCSREPEVSLPRRSRAHRPPAQFRRPPPGPRSTRCARSAPLVTGRLVAGARNPATQDPAGNETPSNQG